MFSSLLFQPSKVDANLTEDARAATAVLNDILFQMTPDMLSNDILETDPNIIYRRNDNRTNPPQPPLPRDKTPRQESVGEVAAAAFKKSKGKSLGGGIGKGTAARHMP